MTKPLALLALALAPTLTYAQADTAPPNDGQRYVSVGAQGDSQHNREAMSTLSLPVGRNAWVQGGLGKARSDAAAGGHKPGIVAGAVGVAGRNVQLTVSASHRADGGAYRQTDVGSSLDWKQDGNDIGVDVTHRRSRASGNVASSSGGTPQPTTARLAGTGVGVHGTLAATEHVSLYASTLRNHYKATTSTTTQTAPTPSGGLFGSNPLLGRALLGGTSVVNRDEVALDNTTQVGATYRWTKVAVSGEYTTGKVHDGGGAMHAVDVKAAIDVAPGWRVTPGIGRGTGDQGGHATFASVSATYGW